jgi:Tfp pilus assembly protein PilN
VRPVNLIPAESRRGDNAPLRTGPTPYIVVAALVIALALVTVMTLTSNGVKDREDQIATLEAREAEARARAEALQPYAEFAALSDARDATVTSLAQSRFDWERVLRELALVIPDDVWLTSATGTVSPEAGLEGGDGVDGRDEISGPALELIGCGTSMEAVAGFVAALRDIDGVTRVGIASSERNAPTQETSADAGAAPTGATADCRTRDFIARFEIVAAFDAVPAPAAAEAVPPPAEVAAPAPETNSVEEQTGEAEEATEIVTGLAQ